MNNKKIFLLGVVIITILTVLYIAATVFYVQREVNAPTNPPLQNGNKVEDPQIAGIAITSVKADDLIASPLKITGTVNGNGWTGFEGQVGTVKLFDSTNKELALGILTATTDWMKLPTNFETNLFFEYPGEGTGKLVFYNENASGEPQRDRTFTIPVKLQKSSAEKTTVKVYFSTNESVAVSCENVVAAERELPKTQAPARAALEELFKGPTSLEKLAGFMTNISAGVAIKSLTIENAVAKVDFSGELDKNVAGSCRVQAIRAQITQTLKQFPTVKSVVISVDGRTADILQP